MASSSPPRDAISGWALPPKTHASSSDDPFSPSFENALGLLDEARNAGLVFALAMPEPEALHAAAHKAGITPQQALKAYLTILNYDA